MSGFNHRTGHSLNSTILLLLAMVLLFARADAARAATVGGNCSVNTITYKVADTTFLTVTTYPAAITGFGTQFVQGGTGASCIVLQFTAYAGTQPGNASYIVFDLDGNQTAGQLFAEKVAAGRTELTTLVRTLTGVTPGTHFLRVKVYSSDGATVSVGNSTLLVHYRK
jgi:hypothetical protein